MFLQRWICIAIVAMLCLGGLQIVAQEQAIQEQKPFLLEKQLPERTLVFASFPNLAKAGEAFQETGLCKIYREPEVRQLIETLLTPYQQQIEQGLGRVQHQLGMSLEEVVTIFSGEVALGFVDIDYTDQMMPVAAVLSLQFGENRKQVEQLLELAKQMMRLSFQTESYKEVEIHIAQGPPVCYAFVSNNLVMTTKAALLKEILDNYSAGYEHLLCNTDNFRLAKEKVQREDVPLAMLYIDVEKAIQQFGAAIPPPVSQTLRRTGVLNIKSISFGSNIDGGYSHDVFFLHIDDAKKTAFSLGDFGAVSPDLLERIPAHSISFTLSHFDATEFLDSIEGILQQVAHMIAPGEDAFAMYQAMTKEAESKIGFSIREDFLASLGKNQYSFTYMPGEGGLLPRTVSAVELADEQRFLKCSNQLAGLLGLEMKETAYNGKKFSYFVSPLGAPGTNPFDDLDSLRDPFEAIVKSLGMGFSGMTYMVEDGYLYSASDGQTMKSFLDERESWQQDIAENADFAKIRGTIPEDASLVIYADYRPVFNMLWNTFIPIIRHLEGYARGFGIPLETALLPHPTTISQHLLPSTFSYTFSDQGIQMTSHSSVGATLPAVAVTGIAAAIAIPAIVRARLQANESAAIGTLRTIVTSQVMFQQYCTVDQDLDGKGEYGFLGELSGQSPLRGRKTPGEQLIFSLNVNRDGIVERNGYFFSCYLPGRDQAMSEKAGEAKALDENEDSEIIDAQEQAFIVYAWPVEPESTGVRVFAINQEGEIVSTVPTFQAYDRWNIPKANAALEQGTNDSTLAGKIAVGSHGNDGNFWTSAGW